MKYLSVLGLVLILASCSKTGQTCTARNADGVAMYEVVGSTICDDQISRENGEYCDCEGRD